MKRRHGALLVALFALLVYLPSLRNGFAYDDVPVIEQDARVHTLEQPWRLLVASWWLDGEAIHALYRPVVTTSFAVDWALYRGAPAGFHFTNAVANAVAAALVFLLLLHFASAPAALAGALLFAVHPVHVEAVANVVGRADVLAAVFSLAAMLLWLRRRYLRSLVPLLFLLALGSKESAIMLPAVLVLLDAGTGRLSRSSARRWLADRAVAFGLLAATAVLMLLLRHAVLGTFTPEQLDPVVEVVPHGGARIITALQVWPHLLRLLLVPRALLADYGPRILMPATSFTASAALGLLLLGGAVAGGLLALARGRGRAAIVLLWVPLVMLPAANLLMPIGVLLAERTLYLAVFGVCLAAAAAFDALAGRATQAQQPVQPPVQAATRQAARKARSSPSARPMPRARAARSMDRPWLAPAIATAVVATLFTARTVVRIPDWRSTDAVFEALMRDRPDAFRAHWHYARVAWGAGRHDEAAARYRTAIELWPHRRALTLEASRFAVESGRIPDARDFAAEAVRRWPDDLVALRRLAATSLDLGDTATARATMVRGLRLYPRDELFLRMHEFIGEAPSR